MNAVYLQLAGLTGVALSAKAYFVFSCREKASVAPLVAMMAGAASLALGAHATQIEHDKHPERPDMFEVVFPLVTQKPGG